MRIINRNTKKALIYYYNNFYVVSTSMRPRTGLETLIFEADPQGNVTNWIQVGGGKGLTLSDVLRNIGDHLAHRRDNEKKNKNNS